MYVYHVVTERPMHLGQTITFDASHHSGVYQRVQEKSALVQDIYANPAKYKNQKLEHHLSVALRELALEEVRQERFPFYPSRMSCLYVSETQEEAERWAEYFVKLGRPTFSIVKLTFDGNFFTGDAEKCFDGSTDKQENLRLARLYWEANAAAALKPSICEMLIDGKIEVIEIVKEINANLKPNTTDIPRP